MHEDPQNQKIQEKTMVLHAEMKVPRYYSDYRLYHSPACSLQVCPVKLVAISNEDYKKTHQKNHKRM